MLNSWLGERFTLAGRNAVVTGAGGGLGRVFARTLAAQGATVIVADRDATSAEETSALIVGEGGSAEAFQVDVADEASVERLASVLAGKLDGLHVLVNNAGISSPSLLTHETPVATWDRVIAVNLRGTFLCARALLPQMFDRGGASMVNLASVVGLKALDPALIAQSVYAASKAGVVALTQQLAVEYADRGVRVNAIAPGWHHGTNLGRDVGNMGSPERSERLQALVVERTPLRRTGDPNELAGLIAYLCSGASSFVTGQVFAHDGGWMAW